MVKLSYICRRVLQRAFKFDYWHVSPYQSRPYAQFIVVELNKRVPRVRSVEIGCGLGDIVRRLQFDEKFGMDEEQAVLKAARFLERLNPFGKGGKTHFCEASFPDVSLDGLYDAIIMVNWIHNIPLATLREGVDKFFAAHLNPQGVLVLDVLQNSSYQYNHDIEEICQDLDCNINLSEPFEYGRQIAFITKLGT